jgi:N-acetylglucosaminyldiphosphoundecaprenol N-acetyl-beta-D-mannosaminyltransferase
MVSDSGIGQERILGVDVSMGSLEEVCLVLAQWAATPGELPRYLICINPHSFECCRRIREFAAAVKNADLVIPDGIGVVVASKLRGGDIGKRVCGPDVFLRLSAMLAKAAEPSSVYFLGGDAALLETITERYSREFPGVRIVGAFAPPYSASFDAKTNESIVESISAVAPDVVWVGLGSPKQELWVWRNLPRLNTRLVVPIGAVFDFYGGRKREAPLWVQSAGLQWLHRLVSEPRRLWRRNLDAPIFMLRAMMERRRRR